GAGVGKKSPLCDCATGGPPTKNKKKTQKKNVIDKKKNRKKQKENFVALLNRFPQKGRFPPQMKHIFTKIPSSISEIVCKSLAYFALPLLCRTIPLKSHLFRFHSFCLLRA